MATLGHQGGSQSRPHGHPGGRKPARQEIGITQRTPDPLPDGGVLDVYSGTFAHVKTVHMSKSC